jgi:hypothetical protein
MEECAAKCKLAWLEKDAAALWKSECQPWRTNCIHFSLPTQSDDAAYAADAKMILRLAAGRQNVRALDPKARWFSESQYADPQCLVAL